jgi:putative hydrolase
MRPQIDTHTHTLLSGHAHSTLLENAAAAAEFGLKGFVLTDHGPMIPGASPEFVVSTYRFFPAEINGVRIYHGVETNIHDDAGSLDMSERYLKQLDYVIAGLHEFVRLSGGRKKDTDTAIAAMNNPYVDILAHPDNPSYDLDYEAVVKETARLGKLMEVNDHSFQFRKGGAENALKYLPLCKRYGVRVAVSSDAHFALEMGRHSAAQKILELTEFPQELIVNLTRERFDAYIGERKGRAVHTIV